MSFLDDEIERQRGAIAHTQYRVREMRERLASHELWVRVGGDSADARETAEWLVTYHHQLRSQSVGLDTLYSNQPDPELVVDAADEQRIAVLLPLRLETRFRFLEPDAPLEQEDADPNDPSAQWRLLVRVEPDPVAMAALPPEITADEAAAVAAMWNRCDRSLAGDAGAEAFDVLSSDVGGPARATYLLRTVPVTDVGEILVPRDEYPTRRAYPPEPPLLGLPQLLQLWARRDGNLELLGELQPEHEAIVATARLDAMLDEEGTPQQTWWNSFAAARAVGLATEIKLGHELPFFEVLLCVGAAVEDDGTVDPEALFAAHADAGRLGTLAPLTATNTVAGAPTTDLGRDPAPWLEVARAAPDDVAGLSWALTGRPLLPGVPRPDTTLAEAATAVGTALWPVRGQRSLKDVHRGDLATFAVGDWTQRHLRPFGPFPTLRVGDLPYGVLPVSAFDGWRTRDHEPSFEAKLLEVTSVAAELLASTTEPSGTAAGADATRLLDVLSRTPTTADYGTRNVGPTALVATLFAAIGAQAMAGGAGAFLDRWNDQAQLITGLVNQTVLRRYSPVGPVQPWPDHARLAADHREVVDRYLNSTWAELAQNPDVSTDPREPGHWDVETAGGDRRPPPVLARLIRHALLLTQAEITRLTQPDPPPVEYVLPMHDADQLTRDASGNPRWAEEPRVPELPREVQDALTSTTDPHLIAAVRVFDDVRQSLKRVLEAPVEPMRDALPAVLDTTGHRTDPWFSGLATRRLTEQAAAGVPLRLGAYGWVDDLQPSPDRTPPTRAGLLHAPGYPQALTAAVLRDHVVHDPNDDRWRIGLHSRQIRLAATLAEQVRAGTHLSEAIGRELERRVGFVEQVLELREIFPARPEWQGRRVCDGVQILDATRPGAPSALAARAPSWLVDEYAEHLDELRTVLDTYADLLLADAVHDVVDGRPAAARESLEAAAGLGAPPDLRVLRTQREGGTVRTRVHVALPWDPAAHALLDRSSPACAADPAIAHYLEQELGAANQWTWTSEAGGSVTLRGLGLVVGDVLVVPEPGLAQLAEEALGSVPTGGTAPAKLALARTLVAALSGSVALDQHRAALVARLGRLRDLAGELLRIPEEAGGPAPTETWPWGISEYWTWRTVFAQRLREAGSEAEDADASGEELARRIRALLPPALGLPLVCPAPLPQHEPAPALHDSWLPVVAAVRPAIAAVEVAALVAQRPWNAGSSVGSSVWRPPPLSAHGFPGDADVTVLYGPAVGTVAPGSMAGLVTVDAWAETVPSSRHTTWASFGYDGPRARAPQAVLVVVPPDTERALDDNDLLGAVLHARRQARARAFTGPMPDELSLGLPAAMVLATGSAGCNLTATAPEAP